jgi:hypothetical protein
MTSARSETHALPSVFIGSSKEDKEFATSFKDVMEEDGGLEVEVWMDVIDSGETILAGLSRILSRYDFGVFLLSGSDALVKGDGSSERVPRANVLLEFGMFLGRLGTERTFIASPDAVPDLPSDLGGLKLETFNAGAENPKSAVRSAAEKARRRAMRLGFFDGPAKPEPPDAPRTVSPQSPPDGWIAAAKRDNLTPVKPEALQISEQVVDRIHGWGRVAELEPGLGDELVVTVRFATGREAKVRASRLFLAES